jgi:3-dehydroquinate synthase
MKRLKIASERGAYSVVAGAGAVSRLGELIEEEGLARPRSLVTDTTVGPLWGEAVAKSLDAPLVEVEDGEDHKRWSTVERLLGRWLEAGLHRGDTVAAVGGGVLTDTVGFGTAVYLRGIDWIGVPTTLLAMVDASVGGKTGVNLEQGKNLVGAFWPPRLVVIDVDTLSTLPERELRAGMAEVIKTAWIGDHQLLGELPGAFDQLDRGGWEDLVMRCVAVKARVVSEDERESGRRASLNLGHTLAHALEAATNYRYFLHGEAVAWGLLAAAMLGNRHGLLTADGERALETAVAALGPLPPIADIDEDRLGDHIVRDKKKDSEGVRWVLPNDEGVVLDQRVSMEEVKAVFSLLKERWIGGM